MSDRSILLDSADGVARVTLNRPDKFDSTGARAGAHAAHFSDAVIAAVNGVAGRRRRSRARCGYRDRSPLHLVPAPTGGQCSSARAHVVELAPTVGVLAARLSQAAMHVLVLTREAVLEYCSRELAGAFDIERDFQRKCGFAADYAEGVAAFAAQREPQFSGK
ncbi:MAG: hypothetical protein ABIT36_04735 [Steroidobacteraceae bacterium]